MGRECAFNYEGPPELRARIERALRWVKHPHLGVNVLDAGLVYGVEIDAQGVRVSMAQAYPGCHLTQVLAEDVEAELLDHLGDSRSVEVHLLRASAWTPEQMKVVKPDRLGPCFCQASRPDLPEANTGRGQAN